MGVQVTIKSVSWRELNEAIDAGTANAFQITWIADLPDPDSFLYTLLSSEGMYNIVNYQNLEVDSLLAAARDEANPARRLAIYREAEELILFDAPVIPIFNVLLTYAFHPSIRGVEMSPFGISSVPLEKVWFERAKGEELHARL